MSSSANLSICYLLQHNESLSEYEGYCGELTDAIIHWLGEQRVRIMYIKGDESGFGPDCSWYYHVVPVIDGRVHDAWFPDCVFTPKKYIKAAFPKQNVHFSFPAE